MTAAPTEKMPAERSAQPTVRRLVVYTLLFALVTIGAIGLSGLLGRLLTVGDVVSGDVAGLARALAFTLVGGPLAAVLWLALWRRLADDRERSSLAWGLYLAALSTVSLITLAVALLGTATALIAGDWQPRTFSTGLVWAGVWAWHRWMQHHASRGPRALVTVSTIVGAMFGLWIGVGGAVTAFATLLDAAIGGAGAAPVAGDPWGRVALQALVWTGGGAAIWWWHWSHDAGRSVRTTFAAVALIVVGILGASILAVIGAGTTVFVALRLALDRGDPLIEVLDPLGLAISAALIGTFVWLAHRRIAIERSPATRQADRLVTSGIALGAAATGIGVVVNAVLANATTPLAGGDPRTLLLGGISALIVGGPIWWLVWKPLAPVELTQLTSPGRRVYLIAVFGLSAVVALISLLVIGYRLFEFALGDVTGDSLIDRVRAPLGLLVATGLVAGMHFSVWRRDRAAGATLAPARVPPISRVFLVTGSQAEAQAEAIAAASGASVTVWKRQTVAEGAGPATDVGPSAEQLTRSLDGVTVRRVLVVVGPGEAIQVIPLTD